MDTNALRYCKKCVLPETRPGITLDDEGICSGCRGHEDKDTRFHWNERAAVLERLVAEAKDRATSYDCIVPVSGGKDSWFQIVKCQEHGLKPLAVTWRTPARTEVGQRNLDEMIRRLKVDHLDYTISPDVEAQFMKVAFERAGDPGLPMHMAIFTIPTRLALQLQIPLVVWGENPQLEYGGNEAERLATDLDSDWLARHGCMQGTNWADWVGDELSAEDLIAYRLPTEEEVARAPLTPKSIFLGSFLKWNSFETTRVAEEKGFVFETAGARTGTWDFADIDCDFISLHHYPKWHKFGMTRAFDNLSIQIRYGMISRDEAIDVLRRVGTQRPQRDIERFCQFVGKPESWFWETLETFRNHDIWQRDEDNVWRIPGFLIDDWAWT